MGGNRDVPELLERFMEASGTTERWVTVNEVRKYYGLDEYASPAISGFLHRISCGSFASFPYRVDRIEKVILDVKPHSRMVRRYLVTRRPPGREKTYVDSGVPETGGETAGIFTDYDAIRLFKQALEKGSEMQRDLRR